MTAPFPTRKQEEWRYADLDALQPVWEQFAEPVTLTVGPGERFEEVWLPTRDDVQVRRVQIALEAGAKARLFVLNTAPVYGRVELEVSLAEGADFELYRRQHRHRPFDQRDRHHRQAHRRRRPLAPDRALGAERQGDRLLSRQGRGRARRAEDRRRAVGQGHAARPRRDRELQARARDFRRRREMRARRERRRAGRDAAVLRRKPRARPGERPGAAARRLRHGPVGQRDSERSRRASASRANAPRRETRWRRGRDERPRPRIQLRRSNCRATSSRRSRTGIISTAPRPRRSRRR